MYTPFLPFTFNQTPTVLLLYSSFSTPLTMNLYSVCTSTFLLRKTEWVPVRERGPGVGVGRGVGPDESRRTERVRLNPPLVFQ